MHMIYLLIAAAALAAALPLDIPAKPQPSDSTVGVNITTDANHSHHAAQDLWCRDTPESDSVTYAPPEADARRALAGGLERRGRGKTSGGWKAHPAGPSTGSGATSRAGAAHSASSGSGLRGGTAHSSAPRPKPRPGSDLESTAKKSSLSEKADSGPKKSKKGAADSAGSSLSSAVGSGADALGAATGVANFYCDHSRTECQTGPGHKAGSSDESSAASEDEPAGSGQAASGPSMPPGANSTSTTAPMRLV